MTPHLSCVVKPNSLSNRNSLHYRYQGHLGQSTFLDAYFVNWGQLEEEKKGPDKVSFKR